jgi:hypothetical protein
MSTRTPDDIAPGGQPLELLFEHSDLPRFELPSELIASYGGTLGFESPCVYANFVASLDGVVALPGGIWADHQRQESSGPLRDGLAAFLRGRRARGRGHVS